MPVFCLWSVIQMVGTAAVASLKQVSKYKPQSESSRALACWYQNGAIFYSSAFLQIFLLWFERKDRGVYNSFACRQKDGQKVPGALLSTARRFVNIDFSYTTKRHS